MHFKKMSHLPQQQIKFSKETFSTQHLPDLLLNIWDYTKYLHKPILNQYCQWCIECASEKWCDEYLNFAFVINNLLRNNKNFADFVKISTADKNKIYCTIKKY